MGGSGPVCGMLALWLLLHVTCPVAGCAGLAAGRVGRPSLVALGRVPAGPAVLIACLLTAHNCRCTWAALLLQAKYEEGRLSLVDEEGNTARITNADTTIGRAQYGGAWTPCVRHLRLPLCLPRRGVRVS